MPTALKRKSSPGLEDDAEPPKRRFADVAPQTDATAESATASESQNTQPGPSIDSESNPATAATSADDAPKPKEDRLARFAALRARNHDSRKANLKATAVETQHLATDPALLSSLNRKRDVAQEKLLKADTEDAGDDYERKRAWDWTVEESERWDKRLDKRRRNKDGNAFQDFTDHANKVYKRQIKQMKPNTESYERDKMALVERAAASGGLEIVETEDGELIAVDRDGTFYSTAESTDFIQNKPSKEAVDKLVGEIRKAEEVRMKARKNRRAGEDDSDVTYINDKNKQVSSHVIMTLRDLGSNTLTFCSSTKSWPAFTTNTLRIFARVSSEELLYNDTLPASVSPSRPYYSQTSYIQRVEINAIDTAIR